MVHASHPRLAQNVSAGQEGEKKEQTNKQKKQLKISHNAK
jgi:hypothetical protein